MKPVPVQFTPRAEERYRRPADSVACAEPESGRWKDYVALLKCHQRQLAQRRVTTYGIVVADVLDRRPLGFGASAEVFAVCALDLHRAIGRFQRRVVPNFALSSRNSPNVAALVFRQWLFVTHGDGDLGRRQDLAIVTSGLRRTTIGGMHKARRRVTPAQGDPQCSEHQLFWHRFAHRPANLLAGKQTEHPGQVQPALIGRDVGHVR